jgi:bleomycin hydrolase
MKKSINLVVSLMILNGVVYSQENYIFTIKKEAPHTSVKNQNETSTCWSFSGISFFESELMRMGKKQYDLSEMYVVRQTYKKKAGEYARRNGGCSLSGGGEYSDLLNISREAGLLPDAAYPGLKDGRKDHDHDQLDASIKNYMDSHIKSNNPAWNSDFDGILDEYLGTFKSEFEFDGKTYTPESFSGELGIDPGNYIIFSSFSNHPYYKQFELQVPNYYANGTCYNLPLDEFMQIIDNALMNGYSVAWASKMNGRSFSMKKGVAIVPEKNWNDMDEEEASMAYHANYPEKSINQEIRQKEFDHYTFTGDHGMHIVALAEDQNGKTFYKVKNSWGPTGKYDGFIFASRSFVMFTTTNCMVNKNAIPPDIARKMGFLPPNERMAKSGDPGITK